MIYRAAGEVVSGFHALGSGQTPSYLLDGARPVLFDGGLSFLSELYVEHARRVLGAREPAFLLLTHAHFDHCGGAGVLRAAFPKLRIAASSEAARILRRPRALELIRILNDDSRKLAPEIGVTRPSEVPFRPFEVDEILEDGDEIDLGSGVSVRVLATPGHTRDFLSYYVPQRGILVASEAVGCADSRGRITPEFLVDYDGYLASLQRLSALEVEVLCQGHFQVYVGEAAREFFGRSLRATEEFREWVEELLDAEGGDLDRVVGRVKAVQYDPIPPPKQPESAYLLNTKARVGVLATRLRDRRGETDCREPRTGSSSFPVAGRR